MAVALAGQWIDSYAVAAGFSIPNPTLQTRQVSISHTAGHWLVACVTWHTSPGAETVPTVHVADDAHNWWVPLVRVSGAGGGVAIWVAPNPRQATRVYIAPTDYITGMASNVSAYSGMGQHLTVVDTKTNFLSGTSITVAALTAPPAETLAITACGSDNILAIPASATAGWTSLTAASAYNGSTDYTGDIRLLPRYQVTSGGPTVTYTTAGVTANLVAVSVSVRSTGIAPTQPNANWPVLKLEAGLGSGQQTPRDSIAWTTLANRLLSADTRRGINYELGSVEAGEADLQLRNNDGALNPLNAAGPYYPNLIDMTPVRLTATWDGRVYPVLHHFFERLPQNWRDPHWGESNATSVDAWATLNTELPNIVAAELLADAPYGYWPGNDPAGSSTASNLARNNSAPLVATLGKYGAGNAVADFGADAGDLIGSPNNTGWAQAGLTVLQNTQGYCLKYGPNEVPALPSVSTGWTVEWWARLDTATQPQPTICLFVARAGLSTIQVFVDTTTGVLKVREYNPTTHASTDVLTSSSPIDGLWHHYLIRFAATGGWEQYVDALQVGSSASALPPTITWISFGGQADETFTGRMINGSLAHIAVYPRKLPYGRIVAHYWAAIFGADNMAADWRINQLLAAAGWGGPRAISYSDDEMGPVTDIEGQPVSEPTARTAASEGGLLCVDAAGYLCFTSKAYRYNQTPAYVLGDRPDLGEIPYDGQGMTVDFDPAATVNDVTVTQVHSGRTVHVEDAASRAQRGRITKTATTYIRDANQIADAANILLLRYAEPGQRIATITIDPASNPALWPIALAAEIGHIVTVNRRPLGGVLITGRYEVVNVAHHIVVRKDGSEWKVTLSLVPADPFFFTLDDATYGVLDGPGVLGW